MLPINKSTSVCPGGPGSPKEIRKAGANAKRCCLVNGGYQVINNILAWTSMRVSFTK